MSLSNKQKQRNSYYSKTLNLRDLKVFQEQTKLLSNTGSFKIDFTSDKKLQKGYNVQNRLFLKARQKDDHNQKRKSKNRKVKKIKVDKTMTKLKNKNFKKKHLTNLQDSHENDLKKKRNSYLNFSKNNKMHHTLFTMPSVNKKYSQTLQIDFNINEAEQNRLKTCPNENQSLEKFLKVQNVSSTQAPKSSNTLKLSRKDLGKDLKNVKQHKKKNSMPVDKRRKIHKNKQNKQSKLSQRNSKSEFQKIKQTGKINGQNKQNKQNKNTYNKITNVNSTNVKQKTQRLILILDQINIYSPQLLNYNNFGNFVITDKNINLEDFSSNPFIPKQGNNKNVGNSGITTDDCAAFWKQGASTSTSNIKVFVRFRPFSILEKELINSGVGGQCCVFPLESDNSVIIKPDKQDFTFDYVIKPEIPQDIVYNIVGREQVADVLNGYNGTIFTYGQTGTGKTHTLVGSLEEYRNRGIITRAIEQIFDHIQNSEVEVDYVITCSILEIYKEALYDLLSEEKSFLKIKESTRRGIYVEGLTQISIVSFDELFDLIKFGNQQKRIAATRLNKFSSRSHTIFQIAIEQSFPNDTQKKGILNLIDLAGSEKVSKTRVVGEKLQEACKINLSLSCLGNVIHALTSKNEHVPYRDSKLTRLLQESLGGNFKTSLIVTCSPHSANTKETISTMKFAKRAKCIKNHIKMNIKKSPEKLQVIIQNLQLEVFQTKMQLQKFKNFLVQCNFQGELPPDILAFYQPEQGDDKWVQSAKVSRKQSNISSNSEHALKKISAEPVDIFRSSKRNSKYSQQQLDFIKNTKKQSSLSIDTNTKSENINAPVSQDKLFQNQLKKSISTENLLEFKKKKKSKAYTANKKKRIKKYGGQKTDTRTRLILNKKTKEISLKDIKKKMNFGKKRIVKQSSLCKQQALQHYQKLQQQHQQQQQRQSGQQNQSHQNQQIVQVIPSHKYEQILHEKEIFKIKNEKLNEKVKMLQKQIENQKKKITDNEIEISNLKTKTKDYEIQKKNHNKLLNLENEKEVLKLKYDYYKNKNDQQEESLKIVTSQVEGLQNSLKKLDIYTQKILKEKSDQYRINIQKILKEDLQFYEINLADYFNNSFNFSFEVLFSNSLLTLYLAIFQEYSFLQEEENIITKYCFQQQFIFNTFKQFILDADKDKTYLQNVNSFISRLDMDKSFQQNQTRNVMIDLNQQKQIGNIQYVGNNSNQYMTRKKPDPSNDLISVIYILKHQLIQQSSFYKSCFLLYRANIINQHLESTIEALEWKQIIEYGKAKIKSKKCQLLEELNKKWESLLEKNIGQINQIKTQQQKFELEFIKLKNKQQKKGRNAPSRRPKSRILKHFRIKKRSKNLLSQSNKISPDQVNRSMISDCNQESRFLGLYNNLDQFKQEIVKEIDQFLYEDETNSQTKNNHYYKSQLNKCFKLLLRVRENFDNIQEPSIMMSIFQQSTEFDIKSPKTTNRQMTPFETLDYGTPPIMKRKDDSQNNIITSNFKKLVNDGDENDMNDQEIEHLQLKICALQSELSLQQSLASQFKNVCKELQTQISYYKSLNEEIENSLRERMKKDTEIWQNLLNDTNASYQIQIEKQQKKIKQLNQLVSSWVHQYTTLQHIQEQPPPQPQMHNEQQTLLQNAMKQYNTQPTQPSSYNNDGSLNMRLQSIINQTSFGETENQSGGRVLNQSHHTPQERQKILHKKDIY